MFVISVQINFFQTGLIFTHDGGAGKKNINHTFHIHRFVRFYQTDDSVLGIYSLQISEVQV